MVFQLTLSSLLQRLNELLRYQLFTMNCGTTMNTFLTITKNAHHFSEPLHSGLLYGAGSNSQPIILSDFDGTISDKDVTDTLLKQFGMAGCQELEELWLADKISSKECMGKQIALMKATLPEINEVLDSIQIDPYFIDVLNFAKQQQIAVKVVSDGLDYAIEYILKKYGINDLPIYANHLLHDFDHGWRLAFPYANNACVKGSGNCKCALVKQHQPLTNSIIYVGDGASDFCVSNKVDVVFAKSKLISYCQENHIAYHPMQDFNDVLKLLPRFTQTHPFSKIAITLTD